MKARVLFDFYTRPEHDKKIGEKIFNLIEDIYTGTSAKDTITKVLINHKLDFNPLIPKLSFITNKKHWSGHLMGKAMREIPEEDYRLIEGLF